MQVDPKNIAKGKWWDEGITLVSGCTRVSEACDQCWALAMEKRCGREGPVTFHPERLARFSKGKPRTIAIWNDLGHATVTDTQYGETIAAMETHDQNTYIILTKRKPRTSYFGWPSNVILGVTAENQHWLDVRVPYLLQTRAACKMISAEPLLGPLVFREEHLACRGIAVCDKLKGGEGPLARGDTAWCNPPCPPRIGWVVVGCESGPRRRECKIEWVRSVVEQCKAANVPVFVKQLHIDGKVVHDMSLFPEDLRLRELPND